MRLAKFGFGLLLLRWLPFRFVTRWILRFAVWGGLIYAVARKLNPGFLSGDGQSRSAVSQPSGWTAPPADIEALPFRQCVDFTRCSHHVRRSYR
ncbi:MAG: hypothetical protein R2839_01520 [Thermomicrobiales bacterium]